MKQADALALMKMGKNVFLTGPAGSGKTYILNEYLAFLKKFKIPVAITASTGIAATHLGGVTIHSWSGMGIRDTITDNDLANMAEKSYLRKHFVKTKVLVIDEVSMLHDFQLDNIDKICRYMLDDAKPFGGIQVVLSGDFFQLPPVTKGNEEPRFIAYSDAWGDMELNVCHLSEQHRQDEGELEQVLNDIRTGTAGEKTRVPLRKCYRRVIEGVKDVTKLYTHNTNVDAINNTELSKIDCKATTYKMKGTGNTMLCEMLKKSCLAPEVLHLKEGAIVMFVKNNYDEGYVNGTMGVVESIDEVYPRVKLKNGKTIVVLPEEWAIMEEGSTKAKIVQVPLRLAWAITIHKSQGMTLDAAEIDLSQSFVPGMGYVALSRLRSIEGLRLMGLNDMALTISDDVIELDKDLRAQSKKAEKLVAKAKKAGNKEEKRRVKEDAVDEAPKISTYDVTLELLHKKKTIQQIVEERKMTLGTILSHIEKLKEKHPSLSLTHLKLDKEYMDEIFQAFKDSDGVSLTPVKKLLGDAYTFEELRIARLFLPTKKAD